MVSAFTTIDAAQDALVALLRARPALAETDQRGAITLGEPPMRQVETIYVAGSVDNWASEFDDLAGGRRESYDLHVVVAVAWSATDYEPARDRALELLREIGAAIDGDRTLSGAVDTAHAGGGAISDVKQTDGGGRDVTVDLTVSCEAYPTVDLTE